MEFLKLPNGHIVNLEAIGQVEPPALDTGAVVVVWRDTDTKQVFWGESATILYRAVSNRARGVPRHADESNKIH